MQLHSTGARHVADPDQFNTRPFCCASRSARCSLPQLILKLFVFTLPGTAGFFQSLGLPGWTAYATLPPRPSAARC